MPRASDPAPLSPSLLARLRDGDREAYEAFFRAWYARLADYALGILQNRDAAEDAVQDVMVAVWHARERLPDPDGLVGYLFRSVRNRALNQLRHTRTREKWLATRDPEPSISPEAQVNLEEGELQGLYAAALTRVSPRGREVFRLSRDQGLSYPQIAETLGISVKTVETLMGRVLRSLRSELMPRLTRENPQEN